ncbi:hypothetical protein GGS21DRAFT_494563 [Xylaria nigripes]|nr:hypothetical protein GGS21DRAFT_494563 [Xylaria nigripes]
MDSYQQKLSNPSSHSASPEMYVPAAVPQTVASTLAPEAVDSRAPTQTVPAACLACRYKHLKCDGANPCSRCLASNSPECTYVASRRGYKGPRKGSAANPNKRHASDSPPSAEGENCPMLMGRGGTVGPPPTLTTFHASLNVPEVPISNFMTPSVTNGIQLYSAPYGVNPNGGLITSSGTAPKKSVPDQCIDAFYFYFYPGHPAVLPKAHILALSKERNLQHLLAAMRWVGALYIETGPSRATFFEETMRLLYDPETPKDGFLVQAMIITIIGLDGCRQNERAREILSDAEQLAVESGLYTREYATKYGCGNPRLEESWRRTWWDLYVVDGMIAGVHRQTNFLLFDLVPDAGLPCEEHEYLSGKIPRPMYLEDFDDQLFSGEEREFSSFAYRVASIRNLGRMMRLPADSGFMPEEVVDKVERHLSNWRLHLPKSKRDCLNKEGELDEMMFQAYMINHACTIILHQPLSQLDSSPAREVTACAPHQAVEGGEYFNLHTRHIIKAAAEISKMVTYNVPITSHTHFFTCVLTLSSIVHLSNWALVFISDEDSLRERIRLNIGALNKLSSVWRAAATAGSQVKGVAQEIYHARKAQQVNPSFWGAMTEAQIMSSMTADEGIMTEINLLPSAPESVRSVEAVMPPLSQP